MGQHNLEYLGAPATRGGCTLPQKSFPPNPARYPQEIQNAEQDTRKRKHALWFRQAGCDQLLVGSRNKNCTLWEQSPSFIRKKPQNAGIIKTKSLKGINQLCEGWVPIFATSPESYLLKPLAKKKKNLQPRPLTLGHKDVVAVREGQKSNSISWCGQGNHLTHKIQ